MIMVEKYSLKKDGEVNVAPNFKIKEFKCKDGSDEILLDSSFVLNKLQAIRTHFNRPVKINSAYRTPSYNKSVGGAKNSYHMKGRAFDIFISGVDLDEICRFAESIGIKGIIRYNTFVHVDSRENLYFARNNNGKVTVVKSFM